MDNNINFQRAFFGGFKRKDVMDYIAELSDEFYKYKRETVSKVSGLKKEIADLEKAYSALLEENNALKDENARLSSDERVSDTKERTDIRPIIDSITESLNTLICVLSDDDIPAENQAYDSSDNENESIQQDEDTISDENMTLSEAVTDEEPTHEQAESCAIEEPLTPENADEKSETETPACNDTADIIDELLSRYI
ncbi:MAG: hypothetical protein ACI4F5_03925 [Acutalibacteraceae bacterium]